MKYFPRFKRSLLNSLFFIPLCSIITATNLKAQDTLNKAAILTPKSGPEPRINGVQVLGVRPGHPLLFTIPATGTRPMKFSADKLPAGLKLDAGTGRISGSLSKQGTFNVVLHAKNGVGEAKRNLKIIVGETIALTPPMGWNSWNVFAEKVSQERVLNNAKAMASSGLLDHGWTYVNMDDCWQGKRGGPDHAIQPDPATFPDMQGLSNSIHALGLKIGIYSTPWAESYGRHVGGSSSDVDGLWESVKVKTPYDKKIYPFAIGNYSFVDNDVKQWANWGIDYLKYDWFPIEIPETKEMYDALRSSGRDIIFSLSNNTPYAAMSELSTVSNSWRTGGDIRDTWASLKPRLFSQDKWAVYAGPGHWNDPDMMILGYLGGWGGRPQHPTRLTADEQYTHMSAWCLMSVPLLLGCDLTKLDDFTLSLLTNDEVIAVNQDPLGKQATVVSMQGENGVMAKDMEDGSKAVGLFNTGDKGSQEVILNWSDLKINGTYIVRDLWRQKDLGTFTGEFKATVNQHGVVLVGLRKAK